MLTTILLISNRIAPVALGSAAASPIGVPVMIGVAGALGVVGLVRLLRK